MLYTWLVEVVLVYGAPLVIGCMIAAVICLSAVLTSRGGRYGR